MTGDFRELASARHLASDLLRDVGMLARTQLRLVQAELSHALSSGVRAGVLMGAGAVAGWFAILMLLVGVAFAIADAGVPLHWSFILVGGVLVVVAGVLVLVGRQSLPDDAFSRSRRQISQFCGSTEEHIR